MPQPKEKEEASPRAQLKNRLDEMEAAIKALLEAFKEMEKETGDEYMPEGEYLGVKFE